MNRKTKAGLSINRRIPPLDEWSAEAYMEKDYSILTKEDFVTTLLNYSTFLLSNRLTNQIKLDSFAQTEIELQTNKWQYFKLDGTLFTITGSKTMPLLELEEYGKGKYAYVTTQATNNGVEGFYDFYTEEGNVLTVDSAVLGYCSYQPFNFSASDHVEKLIPKFEMNKYVGLFLVTIMNLEQYRYNYERKCSQSRMKQINIKLPAKNGLPDFDYMENFIKSLPYSSSI
ncbi:MAG: restriction endonuclease subunit S [Phycisphaerales bacterium]|nr:restriction endonuclease subunit S [Phycisphaerales bacterium]